LLEVSSVASTLRVTVNHTISIMKTLEKNELFEPKENHYLLYKTNMKDEEPFIKIIP